MLHLVCVFICLSVSHCILSVSVCLSKVLLIHLSICLSILLSVLIFLRVSLSVGMFYQTPCLFAYQSIKLCLIICLSVCLSVSLSIFHNLCMSFYHNLCLCLSACLSVKVSVYLSLLIDCFSLYLYFYFSVCLPNKIYVFSSICFFLIYTKLSFLSSRLNLHFHITTSSMILYFLTQKDQFSLLRLFIYITYFLRQNGKAYRIF